MAKGVCGNPGLACGELEGGDLRRAVWGAPLASVRRHGGCVMSHDGVVVAAGFHERELVAFSGSLCEYTDAWRDLTWSAYDKIDIPGCVMLQFSDGVIAYLSEDRWALTIHQLPSKLRQLATHRWTLEFDFVIAPIFPRCHTRPACAGPLQRHAWPLAMPHPLTSPSAALAGTIELAESKLQPTMDGDTTSIHGSFLGCCSTTSVLPHLAYMMGH
ncbi:hypothetical protein EDB89DRAFT_1911921 [Lactarius sanguifluus]|nr:hypothetical protein EDB89DRAFT_1911921 [Lactarius sanguifluus]